MKRKKQNNELLSRREFFKRTAQKTLPFMAALSLPSFLFSCGDDDPINNAEGCTDCTNSCSDSCSKVCMDNCENGNNNNASGCSDCSNNCSNTCSGSAKGNVGNIEYTAVDLGLSVLWASTNLGSEKPDEYPLQYYWGDATGEATKEEMVALINRAFPFEHKKEYTISNSQYDIAHTLCENGWRLPTRTEIYELCEFCTSQYENRNGVDGVKIEGPNGNSIFVACLYSSTKQGWCLSDRSSCWTYSDGDERNYTELFFDGDKDWKLQTIASTSSKDGANFVSRGAVRPVRNGGSGCTECAAGCTTLCTVTCTNSCGEACSTGCTDSCKYGCNDTCKESCKDTCKGNCKDTCKDNCGNSCVDSCSDGCKNECSGGCKNGCTGGCQGSCSNSCTGDCKEQCSSFCAVSCSNDCSGGCRGGCLGSCENTCENACPQSCGAQCGGSCGFNCSFSCGTTCHRTAF